jgi:hypothetical protein
LFDFVHEDDLDEQNLQKYRALILPNVALLSDLQCRQLQDYVRSGGSVLATFETSLYTDRNERRDDFGLAEVFDIHRTGDPVTAVGGGNPYLARIRRAHPILDGFSDTDWIPGAEFRLPIKPVENPVLTVVPPYPAYPPEVSYPPIPETNDPAIVVKQMGNSRLVYLPGDVERTMWVSGNSDLSRLLQNCVRWILNDDVPVRIEGPGIVETFAWETKPGFTVHLLNYTNPNLHKGWIRSFYPVGQQTVRMKLPAGRRVTSAKLLRREQEAAFEQRGDSVVLNVPEVLDYEVVALYG